MGGSDSDSSDAPHLRTRRRVVPDGSSDSDGSDSHLQRATRRAVSDSDSASEEAPVRGRRHLDVSGAGDEDSESVSEDLLPEGRGDDMVSPSGGASSKAETSPTAEKAAPTPSHPLVTTRYLIVDNAKLQGWYERIQDATVCPVVNFSPTFLDVVQEKGPLIVTFLFCFNLPI